MSKKTSLGKSRSPACPRILTRSLQVSGYGKSHFGRHDLFDSMGIDHTFSLKKSIEAVRAADLSWLPPDFHGEEDDETVDIRLSLPSFGFHSEEDRRNVRNTRVSSPSFSFPRWSREEQKLEEIVSELENCFADVVKRQIAAFDLKGALGKLRADVGLEYRGFLRVLNMCHDALSNVKAEKLKKKQVKALKFVIENMDENMDDLSATEFEGILAESGLDPLPVVEGIARFYE